MKTALPLAVQPPPQRFAADLQDRAALPITPDNTNDNTCAQLDVGPTGEHYGDWTAVNQNQIEVHPYLQQTVLQRLHADHGPDARVVAHRRHYLPAEYFTGRARVDPLFPANEHNPASGAYVTFEPGARSAWHTHPAGQRLVVVFGVGLAQEWGKPLQVIRPGDVVWCPPGVKHWHRAAPTTAMTHLAVTGSVDGKSVTWMENVTDVQYNAR